MLAGSIVHENFFDEAETLRAAIDAHFAEPEKHRAETHQVWNYWHVPGSYTYLRTTPEKILPIEPMRRLFERLRRLALDRYGLATVTWPYLSLYVAGCQQILHNDARNGRMGFVYSLTRWDQRNFTGGETLVFRERDYFASDAITQAGAGPDFYDLVPSRFNQLTLFDDRLPHAVPRLEGSMVPQEGRIVLHGHFAEGPPAVAGALPEDVVRQAFAGMAGLIKARVAADGAGLVGLLSLRLTIGEDGKVARVTKLFDRLLPTARTAPDPEAAIVSVARLFRNVVLPKAPGPTTVVLPIAFGYDLSI